MQGEEVDKELYDCFLYVIMLFARLMLIMYMFKY